MAKACRWAAPALAAMLAAGPACAKQNPPAVSAEKRLQQGQTAAKVRFGITGRMFDPPSFVGEQVIITGTVVRVLSPRAFVLGGELLGTEVPVLAPPSTPALPKGEAVTVAGVVTRRDEAGPEPALAAAGRAADLVVVATSVRAVHEIEAENEG